MVCERKDGHMASIMSFSACTCFQDVLTEVEENGEDIEEIIDALASGGGSSGGGSIGGGSDGGSGKTTHYNLNSAS